MGFRFRKTISLGKHLKLNISKSGISITTGVKGAHVSVNQKGRVTSTVGIPGSGLSYSKSVKIGDKSGSGKTAKRKRKSL